MQLKTSDTKNKTDSGQYESWILQVAHGDQFEQNTVPYKLILPLAWLIALWSWIKKIFYRNFTGSSPEVNSILFDRQETACSFIKKHSGSWKALDLLYNYNKERSIRNLDEWLDDFWVNNMNAQAVRNRLIVAKRELKTEIRRLTSKRNTSTVKTLSLASGSAQAVIEVMSELQEEDIMVETLLVDLDPTALAKAKDLADKHQVLNQLEVKKASVGRVERIAAEFRPDLIEMIGFLDYLSDDKAVRYMEKIRSGLPRDGVFLTGNIFHNPEKIFLLATVNWPMNYRTPEELAFLPQKAGFCRCRVVMEPLDIHGVAVARLT